MESRSISLIFFLVAYFLFRPNYNNFSFGFVCKERERQALMSFRADLKYPNNIYYFFENRSIYDKNILSTWDGKECCNWTGVFCNPRTGNVVELHLQSLSLGGKLNPSLLQLKYLYDLNLSLNDFEGIQIPSFLGSLRNLRYLDLHRANFGGMIPQEFGNLSNLHFLDINGNYLVDVSDLQWLSHLSSLQHLDMSYVNLSKVSHKWLHVINMFPSLVQLRLAFCHLDYSSIVPTLPHINFTSLSILDLSHNNINSSLLPAWLYNLTRLEVLHLSQSNFYGTISKDIGNLCNLKSLDLSVNKLSGPLPEQLGKLQNLEYLFLEDNSFSGSIPSSLGRLSLLKDLRLQNNELNGSLPETIGHLSNLETLLVSGNELQGVVTEVHFANLRRLKQLEIDSVDLKLSSTWRPPFQLERLSFRNCHIGSRFPQWLKTQKDLWNINLSNTRISGTVPTWFWEMSSRMGNLNLGHNRLTGELPKLLKFSSTLTEVNLSSNHFIGPLPLESSGVSLLDLSHNSLSGPISSFLCHREFGEMDRLDVLDLSNNALYGEIPECWFNSSYLSSLNLESNNLTGKIPSSIGSLVELQSLHLGNNSLSGELPRSLRNCTRLVTIDLGGNRFGGSISTLLGANFSNLIVLRLRENKFIGGIPKALCNLTSLKILDIAHNNLSGKIPSSIGSLVQLKSLHLDNNSLSGELPKSLRNCTNLIVIDLGENKFSGSISTWLGADFYNLILLRLRQNKFNGGIPEALCSLTSLQILDISHNNLSGSIPRCFSNLSAMTLKQKPRDYFSITIQGYVETASLVTHGREYVYSNSLLLVTIIDLSRNNLFGEIPQDLTTLQELRFLNLSENSFEGGIPDEIGKMSTLESLDFSINKLSGEIPQSITDLHFLNYLNLSCNYLSGEIPTSNQLLSFTELSYVGNLELCGIPLQNCNYDGQAQPHGYGRGKHDDGQAQAPGYGRGKQDDEEDDWLEMKDFYISAWLGFIIGFWGFCGVLLWKQSWRHFYFGVVTSLIQKFFNFCAR